MNKLILIATVLIATLSFHSCKEDDPAPMIWEFSDYDKASVSAVYTPDYVNQVSIAARPDYTGEITLKCTNYCIAAYTIGNSGAGFTVAQVDDNTLKVKFNPIKEADINDYIFVNGVSGKDSNSTNISVGRTILYR